MALKVVSFDRVFKPKYLINEFKAMQELKGHPGILSLNEAVVTQTSVCFVMPFVDGPDLFDLIRQKGLSVGVARPLFAEIVDAMCAIHRAGYVFRDLKPENILCDGGHMRICDFGYAKKISEDSGRTIRRTLSFVGTRGCMSPEMIRTFCDTAMGTSTSGYGFSIDFWALGVLLYEMLTGRELFFGTLSVSPLIKGKLAHGGIYQDICTADIEPRLFAVQDLMAADLIRQLTQKDLRLRITSFSDLISHPFFRGVSWSAVRERTRAIIPSGLYKEACQFRASHYKKDVMHCEPPMSATMRAEERRDRDSVLSRTFQEGFEDPR